MLNPNKIVSGDSIGLICPCHFADKANYASFISGLKKLGFNVKEGKNLYKNTYGYAASERERADDFNDMILDDDVKMILFGGGNVGNELLPHINFEAIKKHPKIICSYSNGTTLLNVIYAQTGVSVYYGQFPGVFKDLRHYDYIQFRSHFIDEAADLFLSKSQWSTLSSGVGEGILIGGYTTTVAMLMGNKYFSYDKSKKFLLFLENYESFNTTAAISAHLAHIEQSDLINNITGLLFGHYSDKKFPDLFNSLERFGKRNNIPVVYCDDFGHGVNHAILPIGYYAELNADNQSLHFNNRVV